MFHWGRVAKQIWPPSAPAARSSSAHAAFPALSTAQRQSLCPAVIQSQSANRHFTLSDTMQCWASAINSQQPVAKGAESACIVACTEPRIKIHSHPHGTLKLCAQATDDCLQMLRVWALHIRQWQRVMHTVVIRSIGQDEIPLILMLGGLYLRGAESRPLLCLKTDKVCGRSPNQAACYVVLASQWSLQFRNGS